MRDSSSGRRFDIFEKPPISDQIVVTILSFARTFGLSEPRHFVDSAIAANQEAAGLPGIELITIGMLRNQSIA